MTDFDTWLAQHEERHERLDKTISSICDDIKQIRDDLARRLPVWATIAISLLAAAVGWFAK